MPITRRLLLGSSAAAMLGAAGPAGFPSHTVRIVVPFPPGGTTDFVARLIAVRLTDRLGRNVIVENKPGASGAIGTELVARAAPTGETLVFATINTHGINTAVFRSLPYDAVKDFAAVSQVISSPNVLVANLQSGLKTLDDVLQRARAAPGQLAFGSTGVGGSPHMSAVLLESLAGIKMKHVPYKGGGPMLNDLMAGVIPIAFDNLPSSMPLVQSGSILGVAVTSKDASPSAPTIPTIGATVPGYEVSAWFGVLAPAATPAPIVDYLSGQIAEILQEPETRKRLLDNGAVPVGNTPAEFAAVVRAEVEKWRHVAEAASVHVD
ncbi:MAG: Bug family tripartite tricarboxylate transporter substrate binding protein [Janthinobacterium lividum]